VEVQDKPFRRTFGVLGWWISVIGMFGAACYLTSACMAFTLDQDKHFIVVQSSLAVGGACFFFVTSVLGLYEAVDKSPIVWKIKD